MSVARRSRIFQSSEENEWAVEITFDDGRKSQTKDLRPDLPLVIHYQESLPRRRH
jgi:hypothetical protein